MDNDEELIGGCCVCSDDQGFPNNALVYCDGKGCTVACHTACYGIVSIPDGDWYCRRCEAGENQAPCRLCPLVEGAMKRTSDGHWAHVICALYIPEVTFGNDDKMEPIILSNVPSVRYGQTCSLCIANGRSKSCATKGACCECIVKNCSKFFHVTCAQQAGLLYEDIRKNSCQYPIYCKSHQPKYSKFIRQIPPFQYHSSESQNSSKQRGDSSHWSDFVDNDESHSQLSEKHKNMNEYTSSHCSLVSQHFSIDNIRDLSNVNTKSSNDNSKISTADNFATQIKIETHDINDQIIERGTLNKDYKSHRKRNHSKDDHRRPAGRPLSKKNISAQATSEIQNEQTHLAIESRHSSTNSSATSSSIQCTFPPETLEEFLEQQWESTSDFLLQQNLPNDISSLLSCLYRFKSENATLKKRSDELKHRRDSLRVINANLKRKLSETLTIDSTTVEPSHRAVEHKQQLCKTNRSSVPEHAFKINKSISSGMDFITNHPTTSLPNEQQLRPFTINKTESVALNHGLSNFEVLSQVFTENGPQYLAPVWNISNFGFASFPGVNPISIVDESILRSYSSFRP